MKLTETELNRFSRQLLLKEIGVEGQYRLKGSSVVIIGCGALGCANANNLVRAGVGKVRIIDRDITELNNLHRQVLLDEADVGRPKAIACVDKLKRINTDISFEPIVDDVNHTNVAKFISGFDLVIDATDNLETRYLINDACVKSNIPWIYGAAIGTYGMSMNILPGKGPCLKCIAPELPAVGTMETCDTTGVMNTIPTIIASIQSTEAMKMLMDKEPNRTLLVYDVWSHEFHTMSLQKNSDCECCSRKEFRHLDSGPKEIITTLCGTNTIQIIPVKGGEISLDALALKLQNVGEVKVMEGYVKFSIDTYQMDIFGNGRVIIHGTEDRKVARSMFARYLGA